MFNVLCMPGKKSIFLVHMQPIILVKVIYLFSDFQTTMVKLHILYLTKMAQKPYALGLYFQ